MAGSVGSAPTIRASKTPVLLLHHEPDKLYLSLVIAFLSKSSNWLSPLYASALVD